MRIGVYDSTVVLDRIETGAHRGAEGGVGGSDEVGRGADRQDERRERENGLPHDDIPPLGGLREA